jgi:hypothetical protein
MKIKMRFFIPFSLLALILLQGCSSINNALSPKVKVDPNHVYNSAGFGFLYRFGMEGQWYVADVSSGFYSVGQKPLDDGSTKLAAVRFAPMVTPGGVPMTNQQLIDVFKIKVEQSAKGGRVSEVKSRFVQLKYKKADCLKFYQTGIDNADSGKMNISNDGMICIHPTRNMQFIWMSLSERVPFNKSLSDMSKDEKNFLETLDFN